MRKATKKVLRLMSKKRRARKSSPALTEFPRSPKRSQVDTAPNPTVEEAFTKARKKIK